MGTIGAWIVNQSKWSHLRAFAESRFIRSSAIWVVVVPIGAKIVLALQEHVTSPEWVARAVASLSLPFSWRLLFVASLLCLGANKVFDWRCPKIVRDQADFGGFTDAGKHTTHLIRYLREQDSRQVVLHQDGAASLAEVTGNLLVNEDQEIYTYSSPASLYPESKMTKDDVVVGHQVSDQRAFWLLRDHAESLRAGWRWMAATLYLLGLLAYAYVFGQNLWWVALAIFG